MEVNPQGTSIADAAEAITQLYQPEESNEVEEAQPQEVAEEIQEEVITESVEASEEPTEDVETEEVEDVTDESEQELPTWKSLEELMEAAGLDHETFDKLVTKRKINGVEEEVTLAELRSGNQRDEDYRRKTMELSENKKALEETQKQFLAEQQSRVDQASYLINQLNTQLVGEYNAVNWNELRESDPAEYAAKRQEFQERQQQLNQAIQYNDQERKTLSEQQSLKQQQELSNYLIEQEKLLLSKLPEWNNQEVKLKEQKELVDYLKLEGFEDSHIRDVSHSDHRYLLLLRKAMAYDNLNKKAAPKLQKVKVLPQVIKPGAKVSKKEAQQNNQSQLTQRLRKTGDIHDAAALISALRK